MDTGTGRVARDPYADFLRLVLVARRHPLALVLHDPGLGRQGPYATNPLGFTSGLWIATWLLQVMPLFFYIGAYVHLKSWERAAARGERLWHFALRQAEVAGDPVGRAAGHLGDPGHHRRHRVRPDWMGQAVLMVLSPLWFVVALPGLRLPDADHRLAAPAVRRARAGRSWPGSRSSSTCCASATRCPASSGSTWSSSGASRFSSGTSTAGSPGSTRRPGTPTAGSTGSTSRPGPRSRPE